MTTRPRFVLPVLLLVASVALASPLMHRTQTVISVPAPGEEVTLYSLSYKPKAFEAKISSVKLSVTSQDGGDPVEGDWNFLASNSDGQMHKVEIFTRLLDENGTQLGMTSKVCMIGGGYKDYSCKAGVWRMMDMFDEHSVKSGWYTNAIIATRYPETLRELARRGHEIDGHNWANNIPLTSLTEAAEREVQAMGAQDRVPLDERDHWGPGAPRPPIRL